MNFTKKKTEFQKKLRRWSFNQLIERWWQQEDIIADDIFEEIVFRFNLENISYKFAKTKNDDLIQELSICIYESIFNYNPNKDKAGGNLKSYIHHKLNFKAKDYCRENIYNENISSYDTRKLTDCVKSLQNLERVNTDKLSAYSLKKYREAKKYLKDDIYFLKIHSSNEKYMDNINNSTIDDSTDRNIENLSIEKQYIINSLEKGYSVREIATKLGKSHQTIYNRIDEIKNEI